ncbi:MAG TPA: FxLYD domain-containing protein [Candidatus Sulfotelmatobacter sp.]|nr:FxLYD domain-containing protein [Candidatus Sulfotelmatobacter sp.]
MDVETIGRRCCCQGLLAAAVLAALPAPAAAAGKRDLVVLDHERWIDTLKGTVKNFRKSTARDVTVVVRFLDRKKKELGTQRVLVGDLISGETRNWSLEIAEKNRKADRYDFAVHAIAK